MAETTQDRPASASAPPRPGRAGVWEYLIPILLCAVALVRVYRSPYSASNLDFTPDAQEYVIAAQRLVLLGSYSIEIEGVAYPPRYPPWFSVLVLAPFYAMAPDNLGIGIIPILLFSLVAVMAAYAIGRRVSGVWGGALAGWLLLLDSDFSFHARLILTETVVVALLMLLTLVYLRLREGAALRWYWVAGVVAALAGAMRVLAFASAVPLLLHVLLSRRQVTWRLLAVAAPSLLVMIATGIYNHQTFGHWRRSGYNFWTAVPYDYFALTFSLQYLDENLRQLSQLWLPLLLGPVGAVALWWARRARARDLLTMLSLGVLPITLVHLFYFFVQSRFHLPMLALLCVIGGCGIALLVPDKLRLHVWLLAVVMAATAWPGKILLPQLSGLPLKRLVAQQMASKEPDAVIITALDPVYCEPLALRGTQRRVIPISREVEYASKAVAWKKVEDPVPPPRSPFDHRARGLLRGGAKDVVAFTADEAPHHIVELHRQGVPIYLDLTFVDPRDPSAQLMIHLFQMLNRPVGLLEQ